METLQKIALVFTVIGALNWGLVGLFDINLEIIVGYENTAIVDNNDIVGESKL